LSIHLWFISVHFIDTNHLMFDKLSISHLVWSTISFMLKDKLSSHACIHGNWLLIQRQMVWVIFGEDRVVENLSICQWLGCTSIWNVRSELGIPSDYLSLGCEKYLKIKTRREDKYWTSRVDSQSRRVVLRFSEKAECEVVFVATHLIVKLKIK
jgi:hypothetical protein